MSEKLQYDPKGLTPEQLVQFDVLEKLDVADNVDFVLEDIFDGVDDDEFPVITQKDYEAMVDRAWNAIEPLEEEMFVVTLNEVRAYLHDLKETQKTEGADL